MKPKVLIVAENGNLACVARLPQILAYAKSHVSVIAPHRSLIFRSAYINSKFPYLDQAEDIITHLKNHLSSYQYDWVILAEDEIIWRLISLQEDWVYSILPFEPPSDEHYSVADKAGQIQLCPKHGITIPQSFICTQLSEIISAVEAIDYPLVIKNSQSTGGKKVWIIENKTEFDQWTNQNYNKNLYVVQKKVVGTFGVSLGLYQKGKLLGFYHAEKVISYPLGKGPSQIRKMIANTALDSLLSTYGTASQFHGFCAFDWVVEEKTNTIYFIEANPRPALSFHVPHLTGVDFIRLIHDMLRNSARPETYTPKEGSCLYLFPRYFQRCLERNSLKDLLCFLPFKKTHDLRWCEPRILFLLIGSLLFRKLKSILK